MYKDSELGVLRWTRVVHHFEAGSTHVTILGRVKGDHYRCVGPQAFHPNFDDD